MQLRPAVGHVRALPEHRAFVVRDPRDRGLHDRRKHGVDRVDHGFSGAEIVPEIDARPRFAVKIAAFFQKQFRLRHAEAVDRLLDVADKEERVLRRDAVQDRFLHAVAVLIFVDDDGGKPRAVLRGDLVVLQNLDRHVFEIGEIQRILRALRLGERVEIRVHDRIERRKHRRRVAFAPHPFVERHVAAVRLFLRKLQKIGLRIRNALLVLRGKILRPREIAGHGEHASQRRAVRFAVGLHPRAASVYEQFGHERQHLVACGRQQRRLPVELEKIPLQHRLVGIERDRKLPRKRLRILERRLGVQKP